MNLEIQEADRLQRVVARLIARHPPGVALLMIGGFRYRLLDNSPRFSMDIDFSWDGDLRQKQEELQSFCRRIVLADVKREFGYEGSAGKRTGIDADAHNAVFIDLRFWKIGAGAVEIPIEVTKIVCHDPPTIRTVNGTVYPTTSDADQIEGKIIALLNRLFLQHRDLIDIFLYAGNLRADSPERLKKKIAMLEINAETIRKRLRDLAEYGEYHASAIQKIIDTQVEPAVAQQMNSGGGGQTILAESLKIIGRVCLL
jgi:hypothetical protein